MGALPGSVLFACTSNIIRSPMAAALMKHLYGPRIYSESVGVRAGKPDPFMVQVMDEVGIDVSKHRPRTFEELEDSSFDLVITLSPEAQHSAMELTRTMACEVEFWNTFDPSLVDGSRETMLEAYRSVRDSLMAKLKARFDPGPRGTV